MSRNKENIPIAAAQRLNSALSSSNQLHGDEFFTDSLLDATRNSSQIPTPSPQKPSLTKARRARNNRNSRNAQLPSHRPSASENLTSRPRNKNQDPTTPLKNKYYKGSTRVRTHSLTTPPELREALSLPSPYSSISSPPPQDLTDAYRQIEDEEVLAQTERELSSDDGSPSEIGEIQPIKLSRRGLSASPLKSPPLLAQSSRASTPTRTIRERSREHRLNGRTEALSEASGLSFLKELTDQGLAAKLTPHVSESSRDRAKVREMWSQQRPVAFSKANLPLQPHVDHRSTSSIPIPRTVAFSKATRPLPTGNFHIDRHSDPGDRPGSRDSGPKTAPLDLDSEREESPMPKPLPTNSRLERHFFSRNHGFPPPRAALTVKNLEQQNRGIPVPSATLRSQSSAPSLRSDKSSNFAKSLGRSSQPSRLSQFRKSFHGETKPSMVESSQVDWAEAAADIPIPSVESSDTSEKQDLTPVSLTKIISPDKSRRWDNDFTGQSFQVSESPPVRQKLINQEHQREREIQGIAKKAVATNRLSEIRERESRENLRGTSKSPAPRSTSHSQPPEQRNALAPAKEGDQQGSGEQLSDTPIVIYRSSSNSLSDQKPPSFPSERPPIDRSTSHDHLQRLARAMSATPRSSPGPEMDFASSRKQPDMQPKKQEDVQEETRELKLVQLDDSPGNVITDVPTDVPLTVAPTPKVTGAWTDTILPDTVKTVKQVNRQTSSAPTPHVNAGGWVDTPAPLEQRKFSGPIPTIVEVPEELTSGIVRDNSNSDTVKVEVPAESSVPETAEPRAAVTVQPKSALASILDKQKLLRASQADALTSKEDTLNLGQETIESLQGLLDLSEDDLTTLSRISLLDDDTRPVDDVEVDTKVFGRLAVKLTRLQSNLNFASKGISRLESQVSQPVEQASIASPQQLLSETVCPICNQQTHQPHSHQASKYFPRSSLTLSLPIPLLFRPRGPDQRIPRPTPIGWATLAIWLWYIVENVMCELYCRPAYTDFYVWPAQKEPEFPFVLPTMLARWLKFESFLGTISFTMLWTWGVVTGLTRAIWKVLGMWVGWTDGFAAEPGAPDGAKAIGKKIADTATAIVSDVVAATAAAVDGWDMTMNDDEYI